MTRPQARKATWASASHGLGGRGLGLRIERVTRIGLALSAWGAEPTCLSTGLTCHLRWPGVAVVDPSSPWRRHVNRRRSCADLLRAGRSVPCLPGHLRSQYPWAVDTDPPRVMRARRG